MKVSELTGAELDYWAAKASGYETYLAPAGCFLGTEDNPTCLYQPSKEWSQGGPIIERTRMSFGHMGDGKYEALIYASRVYAGDTMLIAAMRCYVNYKFGEEVPDASRR